MNAVEIEEAISRLAEASFDAAIFPFQFLEAFGNKETTIKRLRETGPRSTNKSDVPGGVLQRNNIHIAVCAEGKVSETLTVLKTSPATVKGKAKFVLATDGDLLEVEDLATGEAIACQLKDLGRHFGMLLPLAGISTVPQIKNNPIDIKATSRLNRLYVELLKENEDWGTEARRPDLNQFMARLIFCFFAQDTGIFSGEKLFTATLYQLTDNQSSNTHEVVKELFRAMDTKIADRARAGFRPWADAFPYVNGGLFTARNEVPRFSKMARTYLLRAGDLDWKAINPDIFGSMIQAVADTDERGELGMHYTSVPNILKVLDPLFLDDLREKLEEAGDNKRKLQNLLKRLSRIRVFDPACGSGNFLVIAYRHMREIERRIIIRLQGGKGADEELTDTVKYHGERSAIPLTNFYGIEIKSFAAEVARLALLIAEFQCDVNYIVLRRLSVRTGRG
jgi:N-6 DNA Methylase